MIGKEAIALRRILCFYGIRKERLKQGGSAKRGFCTSPPDPSLVDSRHAPSDFSPSCAVVYRDFVTAQEAEVLSSEVLSRMKRRRYEKGHWDAVIIGYKEVELHDDTFPDSTIQTIFDRTRQHLENRHLDSSSPVQWLPCHAIDLKKDGQLKAHVDSIRFSGGLVAGLSLLSSSIMRLVPDDGEDGDESKTMSDRGHVDLLLPPNSLYVLTGAGRYAYSHQLLPDCSTFIHSTNETKILVNRDHRLSVIFRDSKHAQNVSFSLIGEQQGFWESVGVTANQNK